MKKMFIVVVLTVLSLNVYSATKCESDGRGGLCCWDTDKDGIFKPIGC